MRKQISKTAKHSLKTAARSRDVARENSSAQSIGECQKGFIEVVGGHPSDQTNHSHGQLLR
ncbi:hypothetical protein IE4872_PD01619 (plasmid) [Rhizobium gallicum]|uniref:Uncharacterized protein n=1 Tax=Rhizobium gallicum TaxID=56730 RepID=A0A1L5NW61_9HYPH|nr:hypothetical protein [Rhizobium sp. 007]APO72140.1 hypothetical protein IE4872_PD01619 [Rhizobium gallicum]QPB22720.1 hypothetical protein ISN39_24385 [Rhizobium sp. 007]